MTTSPVRFVLKSMLFVCLLSFAVWAQAPATAPASGLLFPFNEVEIEAAKQEKALAVTQEYQAKEKEIKANTALPNNERFAQNNANFRHYLKEMEGLLKKDQREKARTLSVEKDVKGLRAKPALPRLYDMLALNAEQDAKLKDLNLQQQIKLRTLYHTGNYGDQERREETNYINEEMNKKYNDALTPDQRKQLAELKQADAVVKNIQLPPLYQKLNLNGGQTDKMRWLMYDGQKRFAAIKNDAALAPEARQEKLNAVQQDFDQKAFDLLDKNQKGKFDELVREANFRLPPFYAQLELTPEQETKIKETLLWQGKQVAALNAQANLTPEQKQERLGKINSELETRIKTALTPEQFTKLTNLLMEAQKKKQ
ncbi:MAG: hypothetical protein HOP19_19430 [Acidobacteria bacterium]|nr:hypothetical protein [Acidobacteriota bacterium]